MEVKIKYWSNDSQETNIRTVFCKSCDELKEVVDTLLDERPDIDNVEAFMDGKDVFRIQNVRLRQMSNANAAVS